MVTQEEKNKIEARAAKISKTKELARNLEQAIDGYVKESCKDAIELIKGAKDINIIHETKHPQKATHQEIGFSKDNKKYKLSMYLGTTFDDENLISKPNANDGFQHFEQLINSDSEIRIVDIDTNKTVWYSHELSREMDNIKCPGMNALDLHKNIGLSKAMYLWSAFQTECKKQNFKSKLLSATERLAINGHADFPNFQFWAPTYSERK